MIEEHGKDRRRFLRHAVVRPCKIVDSRSLRPSAAGSTTDVSEGGSLVCVQRDRMYAPGDQVEIGIAVSAIILGACVAVAARPPLWLAVGVVAIFAIFHGHAHGSELPEAAAPIAYGAGFVISTGLLHAAGITLGLLLYWEWGERVVQICGAIVCVAGIYFLVGAVGA